MIVDWRDTDRVALLLMRAYPDVDPGGLEFGELTQMIMELPGVHDREGTLDQEILEAIQDAWNKEFEGERE